MSSNELVILERTAEYLIVNKPGGLLTQAPPGIDSLETRLKQWKQGLAPSRPPYIGIPHRLDRPVSGIMVIGQTKKWTQRISEQFQERRVRKHYWAVVEGELSDEIGCRWVDWMRKLPEEAKSEIVAADQPGAQEAILTYEVVATRNRLTWLRIELETGRTHQIRLQCAHHGHPVVGDELYHSRLKFGPQTTDLRARWIGLHARQLTFAHPRDGSPLVYQAGLSSVWGPLTKLFPEMLEVDV